MKQDLRISITKRMIKEALLELLKEKPLAKITVSELCKCSGVNRATFYRHYDTLEDVLHEIETEFLKQLLQTKKPPQTMEEARQHLEAVCTYLYQHSDLVKLLFLNKTNMDILQDIHAFYQEFLSFRKEEFPFGNLDEDTFQIRMAFLIGGGLSLLRKWILDDIKKTPAEIAAILSDVIRWP